MARFDNSESVVIAMINHPSSVVINLVSLRMYRNMKLGLPGIAISTMVALQNSVKHSNLNFASSPPMGAGVGTGMDSGGGADDIGLKGAALDPEKSV